MKKISESDLEKKVSQMRVPTDVEALNDVEKKLVYAEMQQQDSTIKTPKCITTFFRQLKFFKQTRIWAIVVTAILSLVFPLHLSCALYRTSQEITGT